MADWTTTLTEWSIRSAGAIAGSSVSLVYLLPKKRHEAASRLIVGILCGVIFAKAAGTKLVQIMALDVAPAALEVTLMGATAASFASWWLLGLLVRTLNRDAADRAQNDDEPKVKGSKTANAKDQHG
jgi:hypothetical protein